ncbi:MAG: energy-coupling factor transporter transmembrane protein EcfT, partial [Oscillospiraceae bacterium]
QKCTGRDMSQGSLITRVKNGTKILSIMTTWALENAIETADSMKSRGYGLKGRTSYSNFRFVLRDTVMIVIILLLDAVIFTASITRLFYAQYIPKIKLSEFNFVSGLAYFAFLILCILPLIVNFMEEVKWRYLKSKI